MKNIKLSIENKEALNLLGYHELTPIQKEVIPLLLERRNIVVQARTGSGKTCAYGLPLCEQVEWSINRPQALVLACTRELVEQIKEECSLIGKWRKIKVQALYGKESIENQITSLRQKCHILVATPGRLLDLIERNAVDLTHVKTLIIDEADYMLDLGFLEQVEDIFSHLEEGVQKALFSATYPNRVSNFIDDFMGEYEKVEIEESTNIKHYFHSCYDAEDALLHFLGNLDIESALIFCERKEEVDHVFEYLYDHGLSLAKIHGDLLQKQRFKQLDRFKNGTVRILVATDVAARGIDIDSVTHVFHYGALHKEENYIHRCGRSGRMDKEGTSIILLDNETSFYKSLMRNFDMSDISGYESVDAAKIKKLNTPVIKKNKQEKFKEKIEKVYVSIGSDRKVRPNDIVGAFTSLPDISMEDIGVIEVLRHMTYVEIYHNKGQYLVDNMKGNTVKNKAVKVELAK